MVSSSSGLIFQGYKQVKLGKLYVFRHFTPLTVDRIVEDTMQKCCWCNFELIVIIWLRLHPVMSMGTVTCFEFIVSCMLAYVVSCFVLRYPFRQNQLTTQRYSAIGRSCLHVGYIKPAFHAQNTSKHTLIIYIRIYW